MAHHGEAPVCVAGVLAIDKDAWGGKPGKKIHNNMLKIARICPSKCNHHLYINLR